MKRTLVTLFALALTAGLALAEPTTPPAAQAATQPAVPEYPLKTDIVSGAPLGDHPVVENVDGREVRFASAQAADNLAKFKAGGEEMQKKLDDAIIAASKDAYPVKTCLVSGEELGGDMGEPINYVNRPTNQLVKFCCGGCVKKFKAHPEEYLPKLNGAADAK